MSATIINFEDRRKKGAIRRETGADSDPVHQTSQYAIIALMLHRDRSWKYVIDQQFRDRPLDALALLLLAAFDIVQQQVR
jgi:hypothetical protein